MNTSARKLVEALLADAEKMEQLMYDQASTAGAALSAEDYSAAAVACHRAHQFKLVAQALTEQAMR